MSGDIPKPARGLDMLVFFKIVFIYDKYWLLRRSGHSAGDDPNNPERPERAG